MLANFSSRVSRAQCNANNCKYGFFPLSEVLSITRFRTIFSILHLRSHRCNLCTPVDLRLCPFSSRFTFDRKTCRLPEASASVMQEEREGGGVGGLSLLAILRFRKVVPLLARGDGSRSESGRSACYRPGLKISGAIHAASSRGCERETHCLLNYPDSESFARACRMVDVSGMRDRGSAPRPDY